ncbi:SCO family protein [Streptomyces sp. 7-21]|uniref:SCO family protein n=1 Tax=Streptomyces sp. 7-21 TaxID=2802283 RepID=UPI00191C9857|nr:SCO family protein [Streptomyces sp. 7-21]MBL1067962.1 SCO family protein [Streptomyces sp. 7-21]
MTHHRARTTATALALAASLALGLGACGGSSSDDSSGETGWGEIEGGQAADEGTVLEQPFDKPDVTLTDTSGEPYNLREETDGHVTLVYFGYTHCPDICPLTMSNIALAADTLTEEQRQDLRVVFITTDPERDTPESLGDWLRAQSPDFTGLTGDFETIQQTARAIGVGLEEPYVAEDGGVVSTHGTQVLAFLPSDDRAHVVYTEGVTAETFERDLPKLLNGELP